MGEVANEYVPCLSLLASVSCFFLVVRLELCTCM